MSKSQFGIAASTLSAAVVSLLAMASANAASTWTFGDDPSASTPATCIGGTPTAACTQGGTTVYTSAFRSNGLATGSTFSSGNLVVYGGGLAVNSDSTNAPNHALDNQGTLEMVLLRFDKAVQLSSIKLGWADYDSDITLLAYTGTIATNTDAAAAASINGKTLANLRSVNGWSLVGNYADVGTASAATVNTGNVSSSWWLVSAYNSTLGGTTANTCDTSAPIAGNVAGLTNGCGSPTSAGTGNTTITYNNSGYDYAKLYSVAGTTTNKTPEPGSLALTAMALFGVVAARRRAKKFNK